MLYADMLEDSSEVFISRDTFRHVCMLVSDEAVWGWPTLNVFAGEAKQQHVVSRYHSLLHAPRSMGATAMYQNWRQDAVQHGWFGIPTIPLDRCSGRQTDG